VCVACQWGKAPHFTRVRNCGAGTCWLCIVGGRDLRQSQPPQSFRPPLDLGLSRRDAAATGARDMAVSLVTLDHVVAYPNMLPQTAAKPPHMARQAENVPGEGHLEPQGLLRSGCRWASTRGGAAWGFAWGLSKGYEQGLQLRSVCDLTKAAWDRPPTSAARFMKANRLKESDCRTFGSSWTGARSKQSVYQTVKTTLLPQPLAFATRKPRARRCFVRELR
jgi:hypothetical protein